MKKFSVAIDGPAGSGKSTIAKVISERMNILYVDSGALYRTITYYSLINNFTPDNIDYEYLDFPNNISITNENGVFTILLKGKKVGDEIRSQKVSNMVAKFSSIKKIRDIVSNILVNLAQKSSIIMDGRDIGTVVLPDADLKIFLTATAEVRAKRRYDELIDKGKDVKFEEIFEELKKRDELDIKREIAPLIKAEDGIEIDTTDMSKEEVVEKIDKLIRERVNFEE